MREHLTFNPVRYWSEDYRVMKTGETLFITMPNSQFHQHPANIKRILLRRCVGLPVRAILSDITSGHHWKEYSLGEIAAYFRAISPDIHVAVANTIRTATWPIGIC